MPYTNRGIHTDRRQFSQTVIMLMLSYFGFWYWLCPEFRYRCTFLKQFIIITSKRSILRYKMGPINVTNKNNTKNKDLYMCMHHTGAYRKHAYCFGVDAFWTCTLHWWLSTRIYAINFTMVRMVYLINNNIVHKKISYITVTVCEYEFCNSIFPNI